MEQKLKPIEAIHKDLLNIMERMKRCYSEEKDYKTIELHLDSSQKLIHTILIKEVSGESNLNPVYDNEKDQG